MDQQFSEELLKEYLLDSREHVEKIEGTVLNMEKQFGPSDIDELFRAFHTLKGNSALLGQVQVRDLSHSAESMLGGVRSGEFAMSAGIADLLLEAVDLTKNMLNELEASAGKVDSDPANLIERINDFRKSSPKAEPEPEVFEKTDKSTTVAPIITVKTTGQLALIEMPTHFEGEMGNDFIAYIRAYQQRGVAHFIVDFKTTNDLNNDGAEAVVTAYREIETCRGKLVVCGLSQKQMSTFNEIGAVSMLTIKKDAKEAVLSLK